MQLGKAASQLGQASSHFRMAQFGAAVLRFFASVHCISLEVFTRRDYGARYASKLNLFFGILLTGFYSGLGGWIISALHHERISVLMETLYTVSICLCVWHRVVIWMRRRRGEIFHTRYSGRPYLLSLLGPLGLSESVVKLYFEPLSLGFLSYLACSMHESTVSTWLLIGAVSIFVQESLDLQIAENDAMDAQDALIESRYRRRALAGKAPQPNQGYSIAQSSIELMRLIPRMEEQDDDLSPETRAMLDPQAVGK